MKCLGKICISLLSLIITLVFSFNAFAIPSVNGIEFTPNNGIVNAGSNLSVKITADNSNYSFDAININNVAIDCIIPGNCINNLDNTYTVIYTPQLAHIPIAAQTEQIPLSIILMDGAGNKNAAFTNSPLAANSPGILSPMITGATFTPPASTLKIGDSLTLTITADSNTYSLSSAKINGVTINSMVNNNDNTYSFSYTVQEGDTDQPANTVPISVVLTNGKNKSLEYATLTVPSPAIDAHSPVIGKTPIISAVAFSSASDPIGIGGILIATITADASNYSAGTITINGKDVSSTFAAQANGKYTVTYPIAENDTNPLTINVELKNIASNNVTYTSAVFTKDLIATDNPKIDSARPVISALSFTSPSATIRAGQSINATINADAAGYSAGAITINGKNVSGFSDLGGGTYSVNYTVAEGDNNVMSLLGSQIPVSVILIDGAGNPSVAYTTSPAAAQTPIINGSAADTITTALSGVPSQKGLTGIVIDESRNRYYVADQIRHKIYAIDITTGVTSDLAGTGAAGYTSDTDTNNLPLATAANLNEPTGLALDATAANLYIADRMNHRIRKIDLAAGTITTVAGNGEAGFYGDGGDSKSAALKHPTGVTIDNTGVMYIADNGNYRVRKVVFEAATGLGSINTIAGDGLATTLTPYTIALHPVRAELYIADSGNNLIQKLAGGALSRVAGDRTIGYSGDGGLATKAQLNQPTGIAIDALGDVYFTDALNNSVRKLTLTTGVISTRAGNSTDPKLQPAVVASLSIPFGMAIDKAGNIHISEYENSKIDKITASKSAVTTASPAGGNFTADTQITLTANITVKKIYYTDDETEPAISATRKEYTGPFTLNATKTIKFSSIDLSDNLEIVNTANYSIVKNAPFTTASPAEGIYNSAQTVTLTSNPAITTGVKIYYTIDGTNPITGVSPEYTTPIAIPAPVAPANTVLTLKFFAVGTDGTAEAIQTKTYTVDITAPATTANIPAGSYNVSQNIVLNADDSNATIYYTTNGISPTTSTTTKGVGSVTVAITKTTTLKFFAKDAAGNSEAVQTANYIIDAVTPKTTATPVGGSYNSAKTVTLKSDDATATIYYTIDGSDPTLATVTKGTGTVNVAISAMNATTTLKYISVDAAGNTEAVNTQTYILDDILPTSSPSLATGNYNAVQSVIITANEPTATIYYTTNGTLPTASTTTKVVGSATVAISKTTTLKFFAKDAAGNSEAATHTEIYTLDLVAPTTTASLASGTFASVQSVTLKTNDATAKIYYTTDGTDPTTASQKYSTPILINKSTTLKYFAQDTFNNSETIKTQTYTIITLSTNASPKGGRFAANQTVTLTSNSSDATIYYTTDGTTPVKGAKTTLTYKTPVLITNTSNPAATTTVLQFFAIDKAGVVESVKSETYLADMVVPETTATCIAGTPDTIKLTATDSSDPTPRIKYIANTNTTPSNGGATVNAYTLADYTFPLQIGANTIIKFFAVDAAGNTEKIKTSYCEVGGSTVPSIYLETIANTGTTDATTLFLTGNVAPFATATLDINTTIQPTISATDGSFSASLTIPLAGNTLNLTATNGTDSSSVTRTISSGAATAAISIGSNNGVTGNLVRVPVTINSGYQISMLTVDISYDHAALLFKEAELSALAKAVNKNIVTGTSPSGDLRIVVTDPGTTPTPIPDGDIAYLTFAVTNNSGTVVLTNTTADSPVDLQSNSINAAQNNGAINTTNLIGDINADGSVVLGELMSVLWMLVDPANYAANGAVDLDADGVVSLWEFQKALNAYVGL